ncbi:hypothetical protein [Ruegeria sp. HKCCD4332]|uniref:hypothetical protein n=1 Tax=Ruegeria sp. HKCCD4332 TaxID=2683021 RepID=UPI0014908DC4|nr:hypothetical protein [Ruegeria sp. HKCCD4332]NOD75824.1 hypothetical protein [Ruegeria sp. HKCCD4332]
MMRITRWQIACETRDDQVTTPREVFDRLGLQYRYWGPRMSHQISRHLKGLGFMRAGTIKRGRYRGGGAYHRLPPGVPYTDPNLPPPPAPRRLRPLK